MQFLAAYSRPHPPSPFQMFEAPYSGSQILIFLHSLTDTLLLTITWLKVDRPPLLWVIAICLGNEQILISKPGGAEASETTFFTVSVLNCSLWPALHFTSWPPFNLFGFRPHDSFSPFTALHWIWLATASLFFSYLISSAIIPSPAMLQLTILDKHLTQFPSKFMHRTLKLCLNSTPLNLFGYYSWTLCNAYYIQPCNAIFSYSFIL